jgi:hypothetical protein
MSTFVKSSVTFPDATQIFADRIASLQLNGTSVYVGVETSLNAYNYSFTDAGTAYRMYQIILALVNGSLAGQIMLNNNPTTYTLLSITPAAFDLATDLVTITGLGFLSPFVGLLHIEDAVGGPDSNGYYMTCTYVSPTQLTASYGGPGDGILGAGPVILYYEDTLSLQSNVINGTNPSGTLITIP